MAEVLADYLLQRGSVARVPSSAKTAANPLATSTNALTTRPWVKAQGDVTVWSPPASHVKRKEHRRTFIQLRSANGTALLSASHAHIKQYLDKTLFRVAAGAEHRWFGRALDDLESELGTLTFPGLGD